MLRACHYAMVICLFLIGWPADSTHVRAEDRPFDGTGNNLANVQWVPPKQILPEWHQWTTPTKSQPRDSLGDPILAASEGALFRSQPQPNNRQLSGYVYVRGVISSVTTQKHSVGDHRVSFHFKYRPATISFCQTKQFNFRDRF